MMHEVTGVFCSSRRLDEALEDLRAEGITGDRVRIADMNGFSDLQTSLALSTGAPTQWITAEYAGIGDLSLEEDSGQLTLDASHDDILPAFHHRFDHEAYLAIPSLTHVMVSIRDDAEMRAVCDIFSRLGTDDVDVESSAA